MQRKLLGVAVVAAFAAPTVALAQSSVQVYGTVNMSFNQSKYSAAADGSPSVTKWGVNSHGSNYGLRSTETLGGGMSAWLQAEFNLKMERDNGVHDGNGTARNSGLGLRGGFGNVYVGTWETPWAQTFRLWDVGTIGGYGPTTSVIGRRENTGGAPSRNCGNLSGAAGTTALVTPTAICGYAEAASAGAYSLWRRFGSSLFYESPVFGGVQGKIAYMPNEAKAVTGPAGSATATTVSENPYAWSGSLTWAGMGGRARAFVANMMAKDWTQVGQTDSGWTVGGGFDFGAANVGATYERYKYKTTTGDSKAVQYGLGLAVPLGSGKIGLSYAVAKDIEGGGLGGDNGAKMINLGYEWALSKRTALGFGIAKISNDSGAAFSWTGATPDQRGATISGTTLPGSDPTNLFVSIRHSF
jgi:predicted porin